MSAEKILDLFRQSSRALRLFEQANQKKPPMELARLTMLNALANIAQLRAIDALKVLSTEELAALIEQYDADSRIEKAKAGLLGRSATVSVLKN